MKIIRTKKIAILLVLIALTIVGTVFAIKGLGTSTHHRLRQGIIVADGKVVVLPVTDEIKITKAGTYKFDASWGDEESLGFITGLTITDAGGNDVLACTANKMDMVSEEIELEKGTYHVTFEFFSNDGDTNAFLHAHNLTMGDDVFTDYTNGEWTVNYNIGVEPSNNGGWLLVFCCIFLIILITMFFIQLVTKSDSDNADKYDERQLLERGHAFQAAYFFLMIYIGVYALMGQMHTTLPLSEGNVIFMGIFISIGVFVTISVLKDAYFALTEKRNIIFIIFTIIGLMNALIVIARIADGTFVVDGMISDVFSNLLSGVLFLYLGVLCMIKGALDKKQDAEDED